MKKLWSIIFVILVVLTVVLKVIIYSKEKQELANLRQSAEQGNAEAQYSLGLMYSSGDGIPKDKVEAAKWYLKAAEQGDASAQMNLGYLYSSGDGIPKDETEGEKWYRKSAEQGNANAQYSLGLMYWSELRQFLDIPKDDTEAVKWFGKSADQGNAVGQRYLALMYYFGFGVPVDEVAAYMWNILASAQGDEIAKAGIDEISLEMTEEQIAEAQKLSREWMTKHSERNK
jgi:TPR repeat protein